MRFNHYAAYRQDKQKNTVLEQRVSYSSIAYFAIKCAVKFTVKFVLTRIDFSSIMSEEHCVKSRERYTEYNILCTHENRFFVYDAKDAPPPTIPIGVWVLAFGHFAKCQPVSGTALHYTEKLLHYKKLQ